MRIKNKKLIYPEHVAIETRRAVKLNANIIS